MRATALLLTAILLLSACDGGSTPPTPTAVAQEPPPWEAQSTPPAAIQVDQPEILVSITKEEGNTLFPMRVVRRTTSSHPDAQGNPIPFISFIIEVKNNTRHDIAKMSGTVFFNNVNGQEIDADRLDLINPISAGATITHNQEFLANEIVPSRKVLKEVPIKDIRLEFRPLFISYANGVGQEIKYEK